MAREIARRRMERAEEGQYGRPAPVPQNRLEAADGQFNAPVVPKARTVVPKGADAAAPARPKR
jgi:hypothetical protein